MVCIVFNDEQCGFLTRSPHQPGRIPHGSRKADHHHAILISHHGDQAIVAQALRLRRARYRTQIPRALQTPVTHARQPPGKPQRHPHCFEGSECRVLCAIGICRTNSRTLCRPRLFQIVALGVISDSHHVNITAVFHAAAIQNRVEFLITWISRLALATFNQRQAEDSTPEAAASWHHELAVFERKAPRSI
jgi:hypothetical protein